MDYYSIDSILANEEKLKVKFAHQIDGFGFYINSSLRAIRAGTVAELPFYLIGFLLKNEHCRLVESRLALCKDDLDAAPAIVDLSDSHFFRLGSYFEDTAYLTDIFYERVSEHARLIVRDNFSENDLSLLSHCERRFLLECRKSFKRFQDFYYRKG